MKLVVTNRIVWPSGAERAPARAHFRAMGNVDVPFPDPLMDELTESLPYWPINPYIATTPWFTLQLDLVRCFWVVLPGAVLWGASFPLALAAVATTEQDAARLAGGVYAANTVGAIAGSLATSFVLIPWIGRSHAEQVIIIVSALSALIMLEPSFAGAAAARPAGFQPADANATRSWHITTTIVLALAMVGAGLLARQSHEFQQTVQVIHAVVFQFESPEFQAPPAAPVQ